MISPAENQNMHQTSMYYSMKRLTLLRLWWPEQKSFWIGLYWSNLLLSLSLSKELVALESGHWWRNRAWSTRKKIIWDGFYCRNHFLIKVLLLQLFQCLFFTWEISNLVYYFFHFTLEYVATHLWFLSHLATFSNSEQTVRWLAIVRLNSERFSTFQNTFPDLNWAQLTVVTFFLMFILSEKNFRKKHKFLSKIAFYRTL